jgi:hypothetical protein
VRKLIDCTNKHRKRSATSTSISSNGYAYGHIHEQEPGIQLRLQEKLTYFWIVEKKKVEDRKAEVRNKEREMQV